MTRAVLLFVALVAGCSPAVQDVALVDVNLRDMDAVATIRSRLGPQDSIAFANYVARHHSAAERFCGQPLIGIGGKEPATVGEAVALSIQRDKAERLAVLEAQKPKHPQQLVKEQWDSLIAARDILMDTQSRLRMEFGGNAVQRSEWKSLKTKMAQIDQQLIVMKPTVFGSDRN